MADMNMKELLRDVRGMHDDDLVEFLRYFGNLVVKENKFTTYSKKDIFEIGAISLEDAIEISINR